jgi:hypothetical protein
MTGRWVVSCCIPRFVFPFVVGIASLLMLLELCLPPPAFLFVVWLQSMSGWLVLLIVLLSSPVVVVTLVLPRHAAVLLGLLNLRRQHLGSWTSALT